jgi:hypothetical protein
MDLRITSGMKATNNWIESSPWHWSNRNGIGARLKLTRKVENPVQYGEYDLELPFRQHRGSF